MTISTVNYGYYPQIHKQSDIAGRTSRICYADNENVPAEKRGKEISDEDYKKLQEQKSASIKYFKAPAAKDVKKAVSTFEKWLEKYTSRPHRYDIDRIKDNTNMTLDYINNLNNNPDGNHKASRYEVLV